MNQVMEILQQIIARQPDKLLSDKSVADMLNVSRDQVWRLTRAGELPKPRIMRSPGSSKGSTRWVHSEIMQYINALPVAD
jgi:predicted DNA-binding transcriptional regulator AlpA